MMLARVAELFVERVEAAPRPALAAAGKLLVVDATAALIASGPLFVRASERFPLAVDVVALAAFDAVQFRRGGYDELWLLVDMESDLTYCELLREDLRAVGGGRVELLAVGEVETATPAHRLEVRHLGGGRPWTRGRDVAEGVDLVRTMFGREPQVVNG
jgi:hypothetical protein